MMIGGGGPGRVPRDPALDDLVELPAGRYTLGEPGEERVVELGARADRPLPGRPTRTSAGTLQARRPAARRPPRHRRHARGGGGVLRVRLGARLPTADEWEALARGGDARAYPWGDTFDETRCDCAEALGLDRPGRPRTRTGAGPFGAEQLAGNVWEWVADRTPDGWGVVRGGSYLDTGWGLRAARVQPADPARATRTTGFRIAIEPREERMTDRPACIDALREVYDPCCADRGISIVDMGVVEDVRVDGSHVDVDLVLTTGWCPFVASMSSTIPDALRSRRRRDRRREGRLGPGLDDGPPVGVGAREARDAARGTRALPRRKERRLMATTETAPEAGPRAQGRRVRLRLRLPHLQLRQGQRARPARRAVRRAPLRVPPAAHARGRAGPVARGVHAGVERRRDLRDGHRGLRHRHDRGPAAAAHRPLPRRPLAVGEVRGDGRRSTPTARSSGAR